MAQPTIRLRLVRILLAITAASVASPLALVAADSFVGLGSLLLVPTLAVAVTFTLSVRDRLRRAWWFGFAVTVGICLPLCPRAEQMLHGLAVYLQRLSQQGTISLSQRVIEPTLLILIVTVPWLVACLVGVIGGRMARRFARSAPSLGDPEAGNRRWQFSTRALAVGVAAACLLLAWMFGHSRSVQTREAQNQSWFLTRFTDSFSADELQLLAEPLLDEQQRTLIPESGYRSFQPPGVNEYRIVAPIKKDGQQRWAIWAYTCNGGHGDLIYRYACAEATSQAELPPFPFPAKRYIEGTWNMIDGVPTTAGPSATVVSVTSPARVNQPIVLRATALGGRCANCSWPQRMRSRVRCRRSKLATAKQFNGRGRFARSTRATACPISCVASSNAESRRWSAPLAAALTSQARRAIRLDGLCRCRHFRRYADDRAHSFLAAPRSSRHAA